MTCTPERIAQLEGWIAALEKALYSGAAQVQHGDKNVRFNSPDDIREAIRDAGAELARCNGRKPTRIIKIYASRGMG